MPSHVAHKVCQQGWPEAKNTSSPVLGEGLVIMRVPSHQPSSVWMRERTHWQSKEISIMAFNSYNVNTEHETDTGHESRKLQPNKICFTSV